jgi:hypothetical protein
MELRAGDSSNKTTKVNTKEITTPQKRGL